MPGKKARAFTRSRADTESAGAKRDGKNGRACVTDVVDRCDRDLELKSHNVKTSPKTRLISNAWLRSAGSSKSGPGKIGYARNRIIMAKKKKRRQRRCAGGQYIIGSTMSGYYSSPARKSRRKTYRTKASAKKKMPANMSLYKIKGGWRRSKRREPAPF